MKAKTFSMQNPQGFSVLLVDWTVHEESGKSFGLFSGFFGSASKPHLHEGFDPQQLSVFLLADPLLIRLASELGGLSAMFSVFWMHKKCNVCLLDWVCNGLQTSVFFVVHC